MSIFQINNKEKCRWKHCKTSVFNIKFHLIWCTKYRRKLLINGIDEELKILFEEKAKEIKIEIVSLEVMPEHVHLFVSCAPTIAAHWIVQQLKGYTSNVLRSKHEFLIKKAPSLWTRSYYCESIGHICEKTIQRYIEDQKGK